MNKLLATCLFLTVFFFRLSAQEIKSLQSPDGQLKLTIQMSEKGDMSYSFGTKNTRLILPSPLGYLLNNHETIPSAGWHIKSSETRSVDRKWQPVWGKRKIVPDQYNALVLNLENAGASALRSFGVEFRACNDGIAFRYLLPTEEKGEAMVSAELTAYIFADDFTAWFYNGEYPNIGPEKLSDSNGKRMPVMTIKAGDAAYLAVHEANLETGDPLLLTSKKGETSFTVASVPGKISAGYHSAWRVILYGKSPGALVDSHLIELLNPAPEGDFSWVKPGLAVWDWRINGAKTEGFSYAMNYPSWVRMVDFAAANNIRYLILDADWYGPEHEASSDPLKGDKVADVRKILQYGKEKGVGIWLYLNDVGGRAYPIEQTLRQYSEWGAAGIKYGFMKGSAAEKNSWTRKITGLCAQYHLLCDFHDGPVHPYGQMRSFPNAVTREFCHSQLDAHRVFQPSTFVTSVFVNMVAGPVDMCNGLADLTQSGRVDEPSPVPSTLAGEMARTLIVFSGVTVIPDIPENYRKHPELLQFLSAEKMPWQESRTLSGEIGEYIVMARQAADGKWLIGAATNEKARELDIPLDFLDQSAYKAMVIQDGEDSDYRTHRESYQVSEQIVNRKKVLHVRLAPGGGCCVMQSKDVK
jgi:alpha-glucosidase